MASEQEKYRLTKERCHHAGRNYTACREKGQGKQGVSRY